MRGWWNMSCWNGLSAEQQRRLIEVGNLPIGYTAGAGSCERGAEVCVETQDDEAPGPRFYCRPCAIDFLRTSGPRLTAVQRHHHRREDVRREVERDEQRDQRD